MSWRDIAVARLIAHHTPGTGTVKKPTLIALADRVHSKSANGCPFCARFHAMTNEEIVAAMAEAGLE